MRIYIIRRILQMIPTLLIISFMIFGLLYLTPGDPVLLVLGAGENQNVSPETYSIVKADLGLDKPFFIRYFDFVRGALTGDLGRSYVSKKTVFSEIMARMPATVQLTAAAVLLSAAISIPPSNAAAFGTLPRRSWRPWGSRCPNSGSRWC